MDSSINLESFESAWSYWQNPDSGLDWNCVFVLPPWLSTWWREFGREATPNLVSIRQGEDLLGLAPLMIEGDRASFIGSADICDYLDFIVVPGREQVFFNGLLDSLTGQGVTELDLRCLRPDSSVRQHLEELARSRGCEVTLEPDGITMEMDLPATWDEYLQGLTSKQRHETRRKLRRLYEAGNITLRMIEGTESIQENMDTFLRLFRESREDKTEFMTDRMESFFKSLAEAMAGAEILRLCFLEFDGRPIAVTMSFDYRDTIYLYNNGYDPEFGHLSIGVVSKSLSVRDSIERGKKRYDFLKGTETYKYRMGGQEVALSRCRIRL